MIVFFFVDNEVRGWQMVAGVVPAVFVPRRLIYLHLPKSAKHAYDSVPLLLWALRGAVVVAFL